MKAYKVACHDEDHGATIVFALRLKDVSKFAHSDICDCPYLEKTVHRAPQFDKYAPGPATIQQYLTEGWHWECGGCGKLVYAKDEPLISSDGYVYHKAACVEVFLKRWADIGPNAHPSVVSSVAAAKSLLGATPCLTQ